MGVYKIIKWSLILLFFVCLIQFWLTNKSYIFTEEKISSIAKKYAGQVNTANPKELQKRFYDVHAELQKQFPGHILPKSELQWIILSAGGMVGSICVMHATLTEYIMFSGSAVDTVGSSGRFWANISDAVLTGEFHLWKKGSHIVNIVKPGDYVKLTWGESTIVNLKGGVWMLEYGRGFLPSILVYTFADMIFSTQDFVSIYYILRIYARAFLFEIFANVMV